jgi:hypothetical protein
VSLYLLRGSKKKLYGNSLFPKLLGINSAVDVQGWHCVWPRVRD